MHFIFQQHCYEQKKRHRAEYYQREININGREVNERRYDRNRGDDDVLRTVVGKLAYIHEVVRHARHYLTRFVSVVEAVRKPFKVLEHIASHLNLHLYAHDVTDVLYEVVKHHFHGVQQKERHAEYHNHAVVAVRYEVVEHGTRDHRIYYTDKGHAEG